MFHGFNPIDHYQAYHLDANPARVHPASYRPAESSTSFQGRFLRSPSLQSDGSDGQSQAEIGGPPTQVRVLETSGEVLNDTERETQPRC